MAHAHTDTHIHTHINQQCQSPSLYIKARFLTAVGFVLKAIDKQDTETYDNWQ